MKVQGGDYKLISTKLKVLKYQLEIIRDYGITGLWVRRNTIETVEKVRTILSLILLDLIIWIVVLEAIFTPKDILIDNVSASTSGSLVSSVNESTGVLAVDNGVEHKTQQAGVTQPPIEKLIKKTFNDPIMLSIARGESGLNSGQPSNCDITKDGYVYSWGIYQINLTQHKIQEVDCTKAFKGKNNQATVVNKELYAKCVAMATDPIINITEALKIYQDQGYTAWGIYNSGAYLRFM